MWYEVLADVMFNSKKLSKTGTFFGIIEESLKMSPSDYWYNKDKFNKLECNMYLILTSVFFV